MVVGDDKGEEEVQQYDVMMGMPYFSECGEASHFEYSGRWPMSTLADVQNFGSVWPL